MDSNDFAPECATGMLDPFIFVDPHVGVDDSTTANGSKASPYKSLAFAYVQCIDKVIGGYRVRNSVSEDAEMPNSKPTWQLPTKSATKKAQAALESHKKKLAVQQAARKEEEQRKMQRLKNLEEAKAIVLEENDALDTAERITIGRKDVAHHTRVKVAGRIHRLRVQKHATFITLTDGQGYLQCVLAAGKLTSTYDALLFATGTCLMVYGEIQPVPEGQAAPDSRELHVDYYKVIGHAPGGDDSISNRVSESQNQWDVAMLDNRHLVLRGTNASSLMKLRAALELAFIQTYKDKRFTKVSPPALVQTQVEGGSTLFSFPYYQQKAYLTQTSQLYLESVLPSLGNVYCIEKSFRAEKSLTRRHLSEYTHVEAELDFIEFSDLLDHLEELICAVIDIILGDEDASACLKSLNPKFEKPSRPFLRMRYSEAIEWLNNQEPPILNENGEPHVFGDDIAEMAERRMTDVLNRPVFLTHFPVEVKAFYMKRDDSDLRVTESVDVLMPGVGEIVGGSLRIDDYAELMAAFKRNEIAPDEYYWYIDQRRQVKQFPIDDCSPVNTRLRSLTSG